MSAMRRLRLLETSCNSGRQVNMKKQQFSINLNEWESWLIALFFKRITFDGVRECATDNDETYQIIKVIENAMTQLAAQGMAPR